MVFPVLRRHLERERNGPNGFQKMQWNQRLRGPREQRSKSLISLGILLPVLRSILRNPFGNTYRNQELRRRFDMVIGLLYNSGIGIENFKE